MPDRRLPRLAHLLVALALASGAAAQSPHEPVDFNRDVRPLLSDRCFKCHGFDETARKAKLRLDTWDGLTAARKDGVPVVPGKPEQSLLVARIESHDRKQMMPPPSSGATLSGDEQALLRRWIAEGAPFARHWAFERPQQKPLPVTRDAAVHPIDRFVRAALEKRGLAPAAPADPATLLRRASLDLLGLPPTPEQLAEFVADRSPDAYERALDRLFASPHFGERMALVWLDAARYADTNGFHHDNIRTAWPYRDWVINAFNRNVPYDRFITEQLAGDLLPEATDDTRLASGFCRMHNINDEGGALDPEYRVEAVCDRIETVATTFLALTFTCVRCHDHKYDPFTQEDYYSLYAIFGSVEERGVYDNAFESARAYAPRLSYRPKDLAERTRLAEAALQAAVAAQREAEPVVAREAEGHERALRAQHGVQWVAAEVTAARDAEGNALERLADGSLRSRRNPEHESHVIELTTAATGMRILRLDALVDAGHGKASVGLADHGNAVVSAVQAEVISRDGVVSEPVAWRWAYADHEQKNGDHDVHNAMFDDEAGWALDGHRRIETRTALFVAAQPFGIPGGCKVRITVDYKSRYANHTLGRIRVALGTANDAILSAFPVMGSDWWLCGPFRGKTYAEAFGRAHGPERGARFDREQAFGNQRWQHKPEFREGQVHDLRGERSAFYLAKTLRTPVSQKVKFSFGSDDGARLFLNGQEILRRDVQRSAAADQDIIDLELAAGENLLVLKVVNGAGPAGFYARFDLGETPPQLTPLALLEPTSRAATQSTALLADFGVAHSPTYARLAADVQAKRMARDKLEEEATPVLVMQELPQPKPTFVLARGRYDMVDEQRPVTRRPPKELGGAFPAGAPQNRLGFAQWLTAREQPLTARVHVNRLWQMLFGTGIVKTAENFGAQADWPSHPELLDWLAVWFMDRGWDQKALLRFIMTSSTYRQSAVATAAGKAADPENRLLSWFPRRRLTGELVRDQALFVSGLLVDTIGGPSVKPYQPEHLWREVSIGASSNTGNFTRDDGPALWRRSLYTFWKRTSPNPQMATFDAPTREFCVVRRSSTNTPLQTLVLWNDVQFLEAARGLAQRTLREAGDDSARLARMFERCTGRRPGAPDLGVLARTLQQFRSRYAAAPADAAALLNRGELPGYAGAPPTELAAWMMVGSVLLALDETLVRD